MADEDLSKLKIEKSGPLGGRRPGKRYVYPVAAILLLVLAGFLYANGFFTPAVEVEVVNVAQTYPSQAFTLLNASGYVVAQRKAAVSSKATGRLEELLVEEGSVVKKGAVIGRLENNDLIASKDQAAANLHVAKSNVDEAKAELHDADLNYRREKELVEKGYVARADYDAAEARYKKAVAATALAEASVKASAAALRGAEVALEYTLIRSPFDAVVLTKDADVGDIITPFGAAANAKAAVVTIADMDSLQVEADVSEANLEQVKIGQPCEIQLDAFPESRFRGLLHMIVPTADRSKATVMVKVSFLEKDKRILPEMSAKVAFLSRPVKGDEEKPRTTINPAAVMAHSGKKTVFLVKEGRAVETEITLGGRIGDMAEVLSGVKAGDRVVLKPLDKVKNGSRIKVAEK
ncbi:MAG TPA: efflux RND transporter periplasmic adaptor subunit [Thermodesulfovibrionales bacterium]|nr:efflux RND transporter periplasmic adaptor subunit [Thermodesulfovibrionales bacterium]